MLQYRQKLDALTMHKSIISLEMEIIRLKKALEGLTGAPENGSGDQEPEEPGSGAGGSVMHVGILDGTLTASGTQTASRRGPGATGGFGTPTPGNTDTIVDIGQIPTGVTLNANNRITYQAVESGEGATGVFVLISYDPTNVST